MKKTTKQRLFHKKESERTKTEKIIRDVIFYGLIIYVAILGFKLVNANIELANAQTEFVNNSINAMQMQHAVD